MTTSHLNISEGQSLKKNPARSKVGSFGGRACRAMRTRILRDGAAAAPKSWQRTWIIKRILATPPWADMKAIRSVYVQAAYLTERSGEKYVVDHIIPLNHPRVCGLHIAANLRAVPEALNACKSNYFCPEQMELFNV